MRRGLNKKIQRDIKRNSKIRENIENRIVKYKL